MHENDTFNRPRRQPGRSVGTGLSAKAFAPVKAHVPRQTHSHRSCLQSPAWRQMIHINSHNPPEALFSCWERAGGGRFSNQRPELSSVSCRALASEQMAATSFSRSLPRSDSSAFVRLGPASARIFFNFLELDYFRKRCFGRERIENEESRGKACKTNRPCGSLAGGAEGNRTPDLLIANETLYQLSYDPSQSGPNLAPNGPGSRENKENYEPLQRSQKRRIRESICPLFVKRLPDERKSKFFVNLFDASGICHCNQPCPKTKPRVISWGC